MTMAGALINITDAGRAALVAPGNTGTDAHRIVEIGLSTGPFDATDRTLRKLPNELKRITTFGGDNVAADTIHVTLRDDTPDQYKLYGLGLYLENGVLFGVYCQKAEDGPIMEKSPAALLLLSADMQFVTIDAAQLVFGDATFTNPPATTERQGVVELATNAETIAGTDAQRAVTPAGLAATIGRAIAGKSDKGHKHEIPDIDGLQSALDTRLGTNARAYSAGRLFFGGADCLFNWHGLGGQPQWVWGGNSPDNMYVWNPSNFSVNYANSANACNWANAAGSVNGVGNPATAGAQCQKSDRAHYFGTVNGQVHLPDPWCIDGLEDPMNARFGEIRIYGCWYRNQ